MPMYTWEHVGTKKTVEVIRSFDDSGVPPTAEEAGGLEGDWEKLIGGKQTLLKTGRWGGGKGNWILVAGTLLSGLLGSCTTPGKWMPSTHQEMMSSCRAMCGKDRVLEYNSVDGQCTCVGGK